MYVFVINKGYKIDCLLLLLLRAFGGIKMGLKISGKITAALMSLILAVGCIIPAAAVAITYTIPEIDEMTVTMPDGITAVTRDSADTDKYFSVFGIDYEQTMRNFENGNIYLQGMDEKSEVTISVTMTQTEESKGISNYNLLSKEKLGEVQANFLSQDEYTTCTVEDGGKIVWLYFNVNVNEGGKTIKAYQANTVYDGKSVNITLQRNGGNVNEADYNTFSLIVSAADFKQVGSFNNLIPYILIGGAVIAALVIIFIIAASRHASHKRKKNKNDKLIEELADKYTTRRNHRSYARNGAADNGGQFEEFTDISSSSGRNETSAAEPEKADPEQEEAYQPESADTAEYARDESGTDSGLDSKGKGLPEIIFAGLVSDEELKTYLHACDIFCFPSITKNEAFGIALAEAMYCAKPAVTFTIEGSGVNYVSLNGITGIECPNRDSRAFAEAMKLLADRPDLREQYGKAARARVEELFLYKQYAAHVRSLMAELA